MRFTLANLNPFRKISGKLTIVTLALLIVAAGFIAFGVSSQIIEKFSERVTDSNKLLAENKANEVNEKLQSYVEKLGLVGTLRLRELTESSNLSTTSPSTLMLTRDPDIASFELLERTQEGKVQRRNRYTDHRYLKGYNLTTSYLEDLNSSKPFPSEAVFSGEPILRNRSVKNGAPVLTIGVPVAKDNLGRISQIAVADLPLAVIQRSFSKESSTKVYLVDQKGHVIAHPDEKVLLGQTNFASHPLVKSALSSPLTQGQLRYQLSRKKSSESYVGSYSKALFNMIVIAEASEQIILEPANQVKLLVYAVSAAVCFASIIFISIFSLTLTKPIQVLVKFVNEVRNGNFNVQASPYVKTRDEIGQLAHAFDGMTLGLIERDKVKKIMNVFHGSAVTEKMIASGELKLGGESKKVAIFFSDIRGFTAFSENKAPEDVVSMLNEYFQEMVGVISARHGEVNKFIGDAIMAMWGAPNSTGDDAYQAVMSCLEMRLGLAKLNEFRQARGDIPIKIGMGLHFGEAIAGNIGSDNRMEYTIIGDAVNMASRIESSTKSFGTDLLLSEDIAQMVASRFILRVAGSVEVKGKSEPLKLYLVDGYIDANNQPVIVNTPWSTYEAEKSEKVEITS